MYNIHIIYVIRIIMNNIIIQNSSTFVQDPLDNNTSNQM